MALLAQRHAGQSDQHLDNSCSWRTAVAAQRSSNISGTCGCCLPSQYAHAGPLLFCGRAALAGRHGGMEHLVPVLSCSALGQRRSSWHGSAARFGDDSQLETFQLFSCSCYSFQCLEALATQCSYPNTCTFSSAPPTVMPCAPNIKTQSACAHSDASRAPILMLPIFSPCGHSFWPFVCVWLFLQVDQVVAAAEGEEEDDGYEAELRALAAVPVRTNSTILSRFVMQICVCTWLHAGALSQGVVASGLAWACDTCGAGAWVQWCSMRHISTVCTKHTYIDIYHTFISYIVCIYLQLFLEEELPTAEQLEEAEKFLVSAEFFIGQVRAVSRTFTLCVSWQPAGSLWILYLAPRPAKVWSGGLHRRDSKHI